MKRQLWDHQENALTALRQTIGQGIKRIVLSSPCGSGKTLLSAAIVEGALKKKKKVAFVVSNLSLIDQTVEMMASEGIEGIGVIQSDHVMTDWSKPVQVASIQTIQSRKAFPEADIVIIDECVRAGTKISTPFGEKDIENLCVGDTVFNATGAGVVQAITCRQKPILKMELSNGRELGITKWHPIFGENGWRHAGAVAKRSRLFSQQGLQNMRRIISPEGGPTRSEVERTGMLQPFLRQYGAGFVEKITCQYRSKNLCELWESIFSLENGNQTPRGKVLERARMLLNILLQEIQEPNVSGILPGAGFSTTQRNETSAAYPGWKWETFARSPIHVAEGTGARVESGVGCAHSYAETFGLPVLLQDRHRECGIEDRNRSGWAVSLQPEGSSERSEERLLLGDVRVENISSEESSSHEDVFNLQVSGHPSYFADGILVHNCHVLFECHKEWMANEEWKAKPFIGLSATPYTKGLGKHFDTLITVATTKELIDKGILSPFRTFATGHPDLKGVKIVAGDYHEGQLSERMQDGKLTADIVETWQKRWGKDKTLCFGVDCAHAQMIQRRFQEAGVSCGYQDANTPQSDRAAIRRSFQRGDMRIVSNVGTLTTGTDLDVRCLIFARPTRSKILYQQVVGRALRKAEGKDHAIILDHSDTTKRLGFITDMYCEELDDGTGKNAEAVGKEIAKERMPKECKQCASLMPNGSRKCPNCGSEQKIMSGIVERDGELVEVSPGEAGRKAKKNKTSATMEEKIIFFAELRGYGIKQGYKEGWAAMKFKEKFEVFPNDRRYRDAVPTVPTEKTLSWIKSRQIAWAKSKKRAENGGDKNTLTARERQIIDRVKDQYVPGTLCTEKDLEDFR